MHSHQSSTTVNICSCGNHQYCVWGPSRETRIFSMGATSGIAGSRFAVEGRLASRREPARPKSTAPIAQDKLPGTAKLGKSTADSILPTIDDLLCQSEPPRASPQAARPQWCSARSIVRRTGTSARLRCPRRRDQGPAHPQHVLYRNRRLELAREDRRRSSLEKPVRGL